MTEIATTDRIFRVAKKKTDDDEKPRARLFDMRVGEVSLVDRAANRRRFIMTKRDDMTTRLQADGRGGFIEVEVGKGDEGTPDTGTDAKKTDDNTDTDTNPDATAKGDADAGKACDGKGKKSDKSDDDKKGDVAKSISMFGAIAERVVDVAKKLEAGESIPENFDEEVSTMIVEAMKAARMTPSRKDRFASALESLQKILAELTGAAAEADTKKSDDRFAALQGEIDKLTQTVEKQGTTIEKQADTIRQLEGQPARSNALPVEGGNDSSGDDDVVWPLDMNAKNEVSKAAAEKRGTSFYD